MKSSKKLFWRISAYLLISLVALQGWRACVAQPTGDTAAPPAAAAAPAAAEAPKLPEYFSGTTKEKWPDPTGGNAGVWATPAGDGKGDIPSSIDSAGLYDRVVHNLFSINIVWTLVTGFLVMFMQAGFACVESGLCRAKNASHTFAMNLLIYPFGALTFYVYGFALGWGNWFNGFVGPGWYPSLGPGLSTLNQGMGIGADATGSGAFNWGLLGTKGFCLNGLDDVSVMALFFFMMVFFDTAATIPTGALAERWSWKNFCIYGSWVAIPYCVFANWVWGGGWLAQTGKNWGLGHGAVDFAGSGVVHAMGGLISLAGVIVIGPRIGKYVHGRPQAIPGHNIPLVVLGTFILAFGWFGFNPGSTLSGTDLRISVVVVNTMLASVAGAMSCMLFLMLRGMKPDTSMMCNGMLSGLVAITAPCAFVDSWAAVAIGAIAGVIVVLSVFFWDRVGIDDPVGAISVHGVNGIWGVLSVGIFANGKYGAGWNGVTGTVAGLIKGDKGQFFAQLLDAGVLCVFGFVVALVLFKVSNLITPMRVSRETELEGLDGPEMGSLAYPDFTLKGGALDA